MDEPGWYWDSVEILGPCLTWEVCRCHRCTVTLWPNGKEAGVITLCLDCEDWNYTMTVIATAN